MAYTDFSPSVPAGTQTGSQAVDSMRANGTALRDGILGGSFKGYVYSQSGGTAEEPQVQKWTSGAGGSAIVLRATNTYSSGYCTQTDWALSVTGDGGTYDAIASEVRTFDGSGNLSTTSAAGGFGSWLHQWVGKFKALRTTYTAHAASTSAHGAGTMATQNQTAVNIDGGSIDGTPIGTASAAEGIFTRAQEQFISYSPASGAGVTVNWSYGGSNVVNNGTNALSFSNVPSGRMAIHAIYCSNFANTTFPAAVNWGAGGKPSIAGSALAQLFTLDGGVSILGLVAWRAV